MSLVLQSNGGGQVTLQEPATASNRTLSLPDATGTVPYVDGSGNLQGVTGTISTSGVISTTSNISATGTISAGGVLSTTSNLSVTGTISAGDSITSTSINGIGYASGAGGTVTQNTSKSTGVTLNKATGRITMNAAALAAATTVSFTLTNSSIAATDLLVLNHVSAGTAGAYLLNAQCGAGSAAINVRNITAGSLSEAIVIGFAVIKAVTA